MTIVRTPDKLYALRQDAGTLFWQVVQLDRDQGEAMRRRDEPHIYDTAAQAQAVRRSLNVDRVVRSATGTAPTAAPPPLALALPLAAPAAPAAYSGAEGPVPGPLRGRVTGREGLLWWVVRCDEAPEHLRLHYLTPRQLGRGDHRVGDEVTLIYRQHGGCGEWVAQ
jgi:hypothetical protein